MSDTPRTDAALSCPFGMPADTTKKQVITLARQLERELAEAKAQILEHNKDDAEWVRAMASARVELAEAKALIRIRDELMSETQAKMTSLRAELAEKERIAVDYDLRMREKLARAEAERDAVKRDAERYRWLRDVNKHTHFGQNHIGGLTAAQRIRMAIEGDPRLFECITCDIPLAHVPAGGEPIWRLKPDDPPEAEPEHFDFAANMDAAIDAALAAREEGKG